MDIAKAPAWRIEALVGAVLVALACALGVWVLLHGTEPFAIDAWWNDVLAQASGNPVLLTFALVMNRVGGTWVGVFLVPILAALALLALRRPWAAAYFLVASILSAAAVQVLKHTFGRARPEDILITSDFGSFPSGHAANAATIAMTAAVIFPRVWVAVVGAVWVVLMAFSRTYLHAHWLTDTLGGALVGAGVALLVAAAFSVLIARDQAALLARARTSRPARAPEPTVASEHDHPDDAHRA